MRRILVTSALPYANGSIHLGHLVETIQTDIWVRFQQFRGHECHYVCADDTHGTPIMLKARAEGITPEQLIERIGAEHRRDFADFLIGFDNYYSTHSAENRRYTSEVFQRLDRAGHIARRTIKQAYDATAGMFLPDRYVKGTCPRCKTPEQYGDSCENCGATYTPSDLIDPISVLSGTPPVERESEHVFFQLAHFEPMLRDWIRSGTIDAAVANKLDEWFAQGLKDWDISRDAPYFGFEIPGAPDKFFYVWLDAPIGYMASFENLAQRTGLSFDDWWGKDSKTELHHFIGKDILYFHSLFWPAVLEGAGYRKPTRVNVHGFLTINGSKMSKSRGTFITGREYLDKLPPEYLRYFYAAKLAAGVEDIDLNLEEFTTRVNADIVGKVVNIASRCASFITRNHEGLLAGTLPEPELYATAAAARERIADLYERREYAAAVREIMVIADRANQYIDTQKPWTLAKDPARVAEVQAVCTQGINLFRILLSYLKPVMPAMAVKAEQFLGAPLQHWDDIATPLLGTRINTYEPLAVRLDLKLVQSLVQATNETVAVTPPAAVVANRSPPPASAAVAAAAEISVDEFARVDLRVARVVAASVVEGADKLLRLEVDLGTEQRTIFAGIRSTYAPEALVGRLVIVVANLKPRKMRFGTSAGMALAASADGSSVFLLAPDSGAQPGMRVK